MVAAIEKADDEENYPDLISFNVIPDGECSNNINLIHYSQVEKLNYDIPLSYQNQLLLDTKEKIIKKYYKFFK